MEFFDDYKQLDLINDPLPLKVLNVSIWGSELIGHALDWSLQYLHQKRCPPHLLSPLLETVLREIVKADLSQCYTNSCGSESNQDEVDAETVENVSYQPLKLMQMVTTKVDEICLRYKENSEKVDVDFPHQSLIEDGMAPHIFGISYHSIKNTRRKLEDCMVILPGLDKVFNLKFQANYFAVFDGHNGVEAAAYSAAHLHHHLVTSPDFYDDIASAINYAFEATDTAFLMKCKNESIRSGTTAVIALITPGDIHIGWVGDSQAILVRNSKPISLVSPHKPDREDEKKRIKEVGGEVIAFSGTWRVNGNLAVSRAIGDPDYKDFVTSTPEITHIRVDGSEECLILACDGLFDVISPQRCVEVFRDSILSEDPSDIDRVSQKLCVEAKQNGSGDNITVIVVLLKSQEDLRKTYSSSKMNGIENPIAETLSSTLESSVQHSSVEPFLNPLEQLNNMKLLESPPDSSGPHIIEPKSPVVDSKQKLVDTKSSPKTPKPKTTVQSRSSVTSTRTTSTSPKSSPLSGSKGPAGVRAPAPGVAKTLVKTATERSPTANKVSPATGKVGISTVTKITVQKDTVSGVSKSNAPKIAASTTSRVASAKTALATKPKPPKTIETEKSNDPKTTLPLKTRTTTAPSNSRLTASKSVKNDPGKVGEQVGKVGVDSVTKSRQTTTPTTTTSKESTGSSTRVTQRPATATSTRQPRPQTATLSSARPTTAGVTKTGISSTASKPGVTKTTTTTKALGASAKVPASLNQPPKTQSLKAGVGKVSAAASQPRKIAPTTSSQPPPSKAPSRAPIKKPLGSDKKDVKVNGAVAGEQQKIEVLSKKVKAQVEPCFLEPTTTELLKEPEEPCVLEPATTELLKEHEQPCFLEPATTELLKEPAEPCFLEPTTTELLKEPEEPCFLEPATTELLKEPEEACFLEPATTELLKEPEEPCFLKPATTELLKEPEEPCFLEPATTELLNEPEELNFLESATTEFLNEPEQPCFLEPATTEFLKEPEQVYLIGENENQINVENADVDFFIEPATTELLNEPEEPCFLEPATTGLLNEPKELCFLEDDATGLLNESNELCFLEDDATGLLNEPEQVYLIGENENQINVESADVDFFIESATTGLLSEPIEVGCIEPATTELLSEPEEPCFLEPATTKLLSEPAEPCFLEPATTELLKEPEEPCFLEPATTEFLNQPEELCFLEPATTEFLNQPEEPCFLEPATTELLNEPEELNFLEPVTTELLKEPEELNFLESTTTEFLNEPEEPCFLGTETNSTIVNPTSNGVAKNVVVAGDFEACLEESVRLGENERNTLIEKSETIDGKVVLENNSSELKLGEVCKKELNLSSAVDPKEPLSDNGYEPTF